MAPRTFQIAGYFRRCDCWSAKTLYFRNQLNLVSLKKVIMSCLKILKFFTFIGRRVVISRRSPQPWTTRKPFHCRIGKATIFPRTWSRPEVAIRRSEVKHNKSLRCLIVALRLCILFQNRWSMIIKSADALEWRIFRRLREFASMNLPTRTQQSICSKNEKQRAEQGVIVVLSLSTVHEHLRLTNFYQIMLKNALLKCTDPVV